jgi:hypothetical protein
MSRSRIAREVTAFLIAIAAAGIAAAATKTYVSLAGRDDAIPKLGMPGIAVQVAAPRPDEAGIVTNELARELVRQVYTRPLTAGDAGDYDLSVTVGATRLDGSVTAVPFEAVLTSARGDRLWRIEGRSDVADAPVDGSVFVGIGRNVVAALIHDGWLSPRQDPDDPPPQAPTVRLENGR